MDSAGTTATGGARWRDLAQGVRDGAPVLLVFDAATGYVFAIEEATPVWMDKADAEGAGGVNVPSDVRFRDITGRRRKRTIEHQESHFAFRPVRGRSGYLAGTQVHAKIYKNGGATPVETVRNIPKDGDVGFLKAAVGLTLQLGLETTASGWQLENVHAELLEYDKTVIGNGPQDNDEGAHQRALLFGLKHWLCRYNPLQNRANGRLYTLTGDAVSLVTGPDGREFALQFDNTKYAQADTYSYTGFTLMAWIKNPTYGENIFSLLGLSNLLVGLVDEDTLFVNAGEVDLPINFGDGLWHHIAVTREGSDVRVYADATEVTGFDPIGISSPLHASSVVVNSAQTPTVKLDDVRFFNTILSPETIAYYYAAMTDTAGPGRKVLP